MQKENIAKVPSGRTRRAPLARRNVLTVHGKEPGYHHRIVNDTNDRIAQMKEIGYEIVTDSNVKVGDSRTGKATSEGSPVQMPVGNGVKGYLMRIRQDWYDEDQTAKQEYVAETERATKKEALNGTYGKLDISRD